VTASLRYELGSPVMSDDENCVAPPVVAESGVPFAAPTLLTEPGEIYVFGPTVALDPVDPRIRYVAYNSLAGTDISVTHNAGATWSRVPMSTAGPRYNIGDPSLAVHPTSREVWHSYLTVPQVQCTKDVTTDFVNTVALTSSKDLGLTWSSPTAVDVGPYAHGFFIDRPALATWDESLFLTFVAVPAAIDDPHTEVVFARSDDRGSAWSISTISSAARQLLRRAPALRVTPGGVILVAWFEKEGVEARTGSVWLARSTDGGRTFTEQQLSRELFARDDGPSLALSQSGSNVYVLFGASVRRGLSPEQIYVASSRDEGATFPEVQRLTNFCGTAWNPVLAVGPAGDLSALWYQAANGYSQVTWMRAAEPSEPWHLAPVFGAIGGSRSAFSMSRSPLVSLGDFAGLASGDGLLVAAWTRIHEDPLGGTIYVSASEQGLDP
jgi:hypothetical protein